MQGGGMPVLTVNTKREVGKKAQSSNIAAGKVHARPPPCTILHAQCLQGTPSNVEGFNVT